MSTTVSDVEAPPATMRVVSCEWHRQAVCNDAGQDIGVQLTGEVVFHADDMKPFSFGTRPREEWPDSLIARTLIAQNCIPPPGDGYKRGLPAIRVAISSDKFAWKVVRYQFNEIPLSDPRPVQ